MPLPATTTKNDRRGTQFADQQLLLNLQVWPKSRFTRKLDNASVFASPSSSPNQAVNAAKSTGFLLGQSRGSRNVKSEHGR